jgi:hypothetical protein
MSQIKEQILLRAYLQSADRSPRAPTYERLVKAARKEGLAGATVIRGTLGAGYHGVIEQASAFSWIEHLPIIVEIVDSSERIAKFVSTTLDQILVGGMVTLERAAVMMYRPGSDKNPGKLELLNELTPLSTMPKIQPGPHMKINENGVLLRIFIGTSDTYQHKPLYAQIVQKVRELGLAGATVLQGTEGYGANSVVHRSHLLEMSTDLPVVIEIVDTEEKIKLLLPHLEQMVTEGMITMEYVMVLLYRHDPADAPSTGG